MDSSIWIDALVGHKSRQVGWLSAALQQQIVGVPDLVMYEVLQGIRRDSDYQEMSARFLSLKPIHVTTPEVILAASQNYRTLRARGITVRSSIDCLIATFCIANDHLLLHNDRDFDHFEQHLGLKVVKL